MPFGTPTSHLAAAVADDWWRHFKAIGTRLRCYIRGLTAKGTARMDVACVKSSRLAASESNCSITETLVPVALVFGLPGSQWLWQTAPGTVGRLP